MKSTFDILCVLAFIAAISGAAVENIRAEPGAGEDKTAPQVAAEDLKPEHDGKEIKMRFEVAETYRISGAVPVGQVPSFGLRPVLKDTSPRLSVLVSGDLADAMTRFKMGAIGGTAKGVEIEATGRMKVFAPEKDAADQTVTYQLNLRDWKKFQIIRSARAAG